MKVTYNKETKEMSLTGSRTDMLRVGGLIVSLFVDVQSMMMLGTISIASPSLKEIDSMITDLMELSKKNLNLPEQHVMMQAALDIHREIARCRLEDGEHYKSILDFKPTKPSSQDGTQSMAI